MAMRGPGAAPRWVHGIRAFETAPKLIVALAVALAMLAAGPPGNLAVFGGDGVKFADASSVTTIAATVKLTARPRAPEAQEDSGVKEALAGHFAALQKGDLEAAGAWLTPDYFYVAPWGALEFRGEMLARYRRAFSEKHLQHYRIELRELHSGPAGDGGRWFRAVVREKYLRESGRRARNAFAEDLFTSGVAVRLDGRWKVRYMQQTWTEETLRKMVPILHAAQPVNPEEY